MKLHQMLLVLSSVLLVQAWVFAGDAPETDAAGGQSTSAPSISTNGYIKSGAFAGTGDKNEPVFIGNYTEFDIKADAKKENLGRAFVELREAAGNNRGEDTGVPDIHEAWVETYAGNLTFRLGRQIIVWGRADSINPTNNLTPSNSLILSSEFDDTRLGNELLQVTAKVNPAISFEGEFVPGYRPDAIPLTLVKLPEGISVGDGVYPDNKVVDSASWAARINLVTGAIDGSISYFKGYKTLPGFDYSLSQTGINLVPTAYKMQAIGGDFSTALGDFGLRGEFCAKLPELSEDDNVYVPARHLEYVTGIDRTIGDFNILVQYSGLYVIDFKKINESAQQPYAEIKKLNRQFTGTTDEVSHSVTGQIGMSALSETLQIKLAGMYDFTTQEFAISPTISYDIADALTLTAAWRDVDGPADSLDRLVNKLMSSSSVELKYSF
jgi:hypothetical protein